MEYWSYSLISLIGLFFLLILVFSILFKYPFSNSLHGAFMGALLGTGAFMLSYFVIGFVNLFMGFRDVVVWVLAIIVQLAFGFVNGLMAADDGYVRTDSTPSNKTKIEHFDMYGMYTGDSVIKDGKVEHYDRYGIMTGESKIKK